MIGSKKPSKISNTSLRKSLTIKMSTKIFKSVELKLIKPLDKLTKKSLTRVRKLQIKQPKSQKALKSNSKESPLKRTVTMKISRMVGPV